jgi:hypothetical protein
MKRLVVPSLSLQVATNYAAPLHPAIFWPLPAFLSPVVSAYKTSSSFPTTTTYSMLGRSIGLAPPPPSAKHVLSLLEPKLGRDDMEEFAQREVRSLCQVNDWFACLELYQYRQKTDEVKR